jgi:hypothetical protein
MAGKIGRHTVSPMELVSGMAMVQTEPYNFPLVKCTEVYSDLPSRVGPCCTMVSNGLMVSYVFVFAQLIVY